MRVLNFFTVDTDYCNYLRRFDHKVFYNSGMKSTRPYIGPLFKGRSGVDYYAPLSSYKTKHDYLGKSMEYMPISNDRKGLIVFRNMLPVPPECLYPIDMFDYPSDSKETEFYRTLLRQQKNRIRRNAQQILYQAETLYGMYENADEGDHLLTRICDFYENELSCGDYQNYLRGNVTDEIIQNAVEHYAGWALVKPATELLDDPLWKQSIIDGYMRGFSEDDVELLAGYRIEVDEAMSVNDFRTVTLWLFENGLEVRPWLMSDEMIMGIQDVLLDLIRKGLPITVQWLNSRMDLMKIQA
ncbi:MAG: type III toxin-antitoxin system ToxN/AbiQ family toxin [Solobacterium sp.]|nr:type III toxin-antitoxin system ToxN/AbiQ family toxin [Solobacterium sp.]